MGCENLQGHAVGDKGHVLVPPARAAAVRGRGKDSGIAMALAVAVAHVCGLALQQAIGGVEPGARVG